MLTFYQYRANLIKKYLPNVSPLKPISAFYWNFFQYKANICVILRFIGNISNAKPIILQY